MTKCDVDCPFCGQSMIKSYREEAKFRTKLIVWNRKGMFAVCKSCDGEVEISPDMLKSIQSGFVFEVGENKLTGK